MCLNSPTLPFLPCFITFCSTHSYTSYFYEIFATCYNYNTVLCLATFVPYLQLPLDYIAILHCRPLPFRSRFRFCFIRFPLFPLALNIVD